MGADSSSNSRKGVFLHNRHDPETGVDFGVNIKKIHGRFVLKDVREDGLAYKTGFRSGDFLVRANSIDINQVNRKHLLKELLDYKEFNHFIGVGRKLNKGKKTFIWIIFKITTKDGVSDVAVLETLKTDKKVIPATMLVPATPTYDFLNVTSKPDDIFIEEKGIPSKYLTIEDNQLVFKDFNSQFSKFYRYNYTDSVQEGAVVAFSLNRISSEDPDAGPDSDSSSCHEKTSPATGNNKKTATAMVFPKKLIGDGIPPDPRFWLLLASPTNGISMQSMKAPGMYLGINSENNKAILSPKETSLNIQISE